MHRQLRLGPGGADQRRQLRGPDRRAARLHPRRIGCRASAENGDAGAWAAVRRTGRRPDDAEGNGLGEPRLSERMVMELLIPILVVIVLVAVAWKLLKGVAKTVALVAIAGLAALFGFGGANLCSPIRTASAP